MSIQQMASNYTINLNMNPTAAWCTVHHLNSVHCNSCSLYPSPTLSRWQLGPKPIHVLYTPSKYILLLHFLTGITDHFKLQVTNNWVLTKAAFCSSIPQFLTATLNTRTSTTFQLKLQHKTRGSSIKVKFALALSPMFRTSIIIIIACEKSCDS